MKHKLNISVFGTYDETVLSTRVILSGLSSILDSQHLSFVNEKVPSSFMFDAKDLSVGSILRRTYYRIRAQIRLLRRVTEIRSADVVIVLPFGLIDLIWAYISKILWKKTVVYVPQNSLYDLFRYLSQGKLWLQPLVFGAYHIERLLFRIPNLVIFNSEEEAIVHKHMLNLPQLVTDIVPLGADEQLFYPKTTTQEKKHSKFSVLFYGEYNFGHGTSFIVEAAHLLQKHPSVHFTMIGEGRTKEEALNLANTYGLKNITFLPWMPVNKLKNHIYSADVILGMFSGDTLALRVIPNKVYQGLACGKAVITGKSPAAASWLTHKKHVYFVPLENARAIANAILDVKKHVSLQKTLSREGYTLFMKKFSTEAVANSLLGTIEHRRFV